ncbi:hypothetical protein AB2M62_07690 [Sphingomonas sp. MMS12-HWE2-04]
MTPLTPVDYAHPIEIPEVAARVTVSFAMLAWVFVVLTLFWH